MCSLHSPQGLLNQRRYKSNQKHLFTRYDIRLSTEPKPTCSQNHHKLVAMQIDVKLSN